MLSKKLRINRTNLLLQGPTHFDKASAPKVKKSKAQFSVRLTIPIN